MKKKKWGKPKLIILTRGKPEERVLAYCKGTGTPTAPESIAGVCYYQDAEICAFCVATIIS